MSNLSKLEFVALDISGKNYLSLVLDAEIHLAAKGRDATITQRNEATSQDKAKAMIFLRHHLDEGLKIEYLTVKNLLELWTDLKGRYDHLKTTVLPRARYEWMHLQFQDFKIVIEYNSVVFRITSPLKLCGETIKDEDMLEKTFTTFHASNVILQQQYREKGFQIYFELISCLLVAEQHSALLMKNHEARPTRAAPLPEANVVEARDQSEVKRDDHRGYNNARGRGKDKRRYTNRQGGGHNKRENNTSSQNNPSKSNCRRCGMNGHCKNECRTREHFLRLYQNSFKKKGNKSGASSSNARVESHMTLKDDDKLGTSQKYDKDIEANLTLKDDVFDGLSDITHMEVDDFFGSRN
ncbi:uncharacterized protein [Solanum lycopersicum]|uniref:uncharacterized protein n=1 Tax=Solanum lycopersicum TaxID=4081 RepID=UPI0002BC9152|nr:uncharacterized protein LOC101262235 [Solanum lycopersicum]